MRLDESNCACALTVWLAAVALWETGVVLPSLHEKDDMHNSHNPKWRNVCVFIFCLFRFWRVSVWLFKAMAFFLSAGGIA